MYESFWQLKQKPFENTSDTAFYFPSESHQGSLLKLRYTVEHQRGAALLSGASGLGKTILLHSLVEQLDEHIHPRIHLVFPQMPADQLLAYIADGLCGEASTTTPPIHLSVRRIEEQLQRNAEQGKHALVIIDEAHLIASSEALETLRLLLNFEVDSRCGLTLLIAGQPSLMATMDRMPELDERLSVKCMLQRLSLEETIAYIQHRLSTVEFQGVIFEADAFHTIHQLSHGVPRRINRLADLALLIGYAEERKQIGSRDIEAVAEELVATTE